MMWKHRFYDGIKKLDALHEVAMAAPFLTLPLRLIGYVGYRGLELALGPRHPHNRVVAQARAMTARRAKRESPASRKVLFFTVRGWYVHVGTEAVLAKALQLRGADTKFFLCGGVLPQCDFNPGTDPYVTRPLCWRCSGFAKRLLEAFGLSYCVLMDVIDRSVMGRARELIGGLDGEELRRFTYKELALHDVVMPSVLHALLRGDVGNDSFGQQVLRGFMESAVVFVDAAEELLRREKPEVIVMTNGLFFAERVMFEMAKRAGLRTVTYERGLPLHTVLFDHNKAAVEFHLDGHWGQAREKALSSEENQRLDAHLEERAGGNVGVIELWPRMEGDRRKLAERLELTDKRPLAVAFTNILWDSAVFRCDVAFEGMFDWLVETIRLFETMPEAQLVVRVHPAEVRIPMAESRDRAIDRLRKQFRALPPNVRVVPPEDAASSYTLIDLADAVIVYSSTIGLEAAVRGRVVVVSGRTHFRGRGWTIDVERKEEYAGYVREALRRRRIGPAEVELARRYAYLFFFRYMQAFPWVIDTPRSERRLTFEDLAALGPGNDAVLDRICNGILEGTPFVSLE